MSRADLFGSGITLLVGGIAYFISGFWAALIAIILGTALIAVAHFRKIEEGEPEVQLGGALRIAANSFVRAANNREESLRQEGAKPNSPNVGTQQSSTGPNSPNTNVIGNNNTVTLNPSSSDPVVHRKLDEIEKLVKNLGGKDEFLAKYPLGYVIFDVDYITKAVTPLEARQGLESYQFDFRPVGITQNTADRIEIRMPDLIKDKKLIASGAKTGGWKKVGNLGGAGIGDDKGGVTEWAEILAIKDSEVTFLVGFDRAPKLPKPHPPPSQ